MLVALMGKLMWFQSHFEGPPIYRVMLSGVAQKYSLKRNMELHEHTLCKNVTQGAMHAPGYGATILHDAQVLQQPCVLHSLEAWRCLLLFC